MRAILDRWLKDNQKSLDEVKEKIKELDAELERLQERITQIEGLRVGIPIEKHFLLSTRFQHDIRRGYHIALMEFHPLQREQISHGLSTVNGEISEKAFSTTIHPKEVLLIFGLKTIYDGDDKGIFRMQVHNKKLKPFIVDDETKEVIFFNTYILKPEEFLGIERVEGKGTMKFNILGISITPNFFSVK